MIVFFDLETDSLRPDCQIIQLAAVAVSPAWETLGELQVKIRFDMALADPEALKINHYTPEAWATAVPEQFAMSKFAAFLEPFKCIRHVSKKSGKPYHLAQLAGHNAISFDGPRLKAAFQRYGIFLPADPRIMDTLDLALWVTQKTGKRLESYRLEELCKFLGIAVNETHDALSDVRLTAQVARVLMESL